MSWSGSPFNRNHYILKWILDNPNLSITIVFTVIGLAGIIFAKSSIPLSDGDDEDASSRYSNSIRKFHSPKVVVELFDNGDTGSITYYNDRKQRVKYIEKYLNGKTSLLSLTQYNDSGQTDENSEYDEHGHIISKFKNVNGEFNGDQLLYYGNGVVRVKRIYSKGKEIQAVYYDSTGKLMKIENNTGN